MPVLLGGDHSITQPEAEALASVHGPIGLVHFDTHTDTGALRGERVLSHGTPMYNAVDRGHVDPSRYVQIGLRGYWPGEQEFAWQRERGITSFFAHDVRDRGIKEIVERTVADRRRRTGAADRRRGRARPRVRARHRHTRAGWMTPTELLWACRSLASRLDLVGSDVVEVAADVVGAADITALVADRVIRESLTGVALRRGRPAGGRLGRLRRGGCAAPPPGTAGC